MKILGIETSCDETAVAVLEIVESGKWKVESIKVLSNIVSSQVKLHAKYGGVVPNLAAREHVKNIGHVFKLTLKEARLHRADLCMDGIDLIAVTRGPGLGPALLVGITFARTISWLYKKPLVGVNHLEGHIYSNWLNKDFKPKTVKFPVLNLLVSGGHTELILMHDYGLFEIVGETMDDAVGEAFDKVARLLGLGYPGGPAISKVAEKGNPDKYSLPRPMINSKDYNFSYSGLKTAVLYLLRDLKIKKPNSKQRQDLAASFQKAAIDVLIQKTMRAAKEYAVKSIMLSGGVSANSLLRSDLNKTATRFGIKYFQPPMEYTTDNAAMMAVAGYFAYLRAKNTDYKTAKMDANLGF